MRLVLPIERLNYVYTHIHMRLVLPIEGLQLCICIYVYEANTTNRRTHHTPIEICVCDFPLHLR